ncbi:MAG: helix-turn-helix domain-containing protein [Candidatus Aenigmarchaeota archaeon]|nr:helix-turn-helix domain-containing protein [Candidatus Aenigmarchaeota archaeon]
MELEVLKQIGLSEGEIKVYFALLELESSTVGRIIEKAGVPDSKIYSILDKLKDKGLVSFVIKNNVKHFQASDPKNILRLLNEKEKAIRLQKKELEEKIIPEIEKRRKLTEEKQEAVVYESMEGLRAAFDYMLGVMGKNGNYQVFVIGEALKQKRVIDFMNAFNKRRMALGAIGRRLSNNEFMYELKKYYNFKNVPMRFTEQKLPLGVFIFRDHVMTVIWEEVPTAFVIKSRKNYEHYKDFFEDVWKNAKK